MADLATGYGSLGQLLRGWTSGRGWPGGGLADERGVRASVLRMLSWKLRTLPLVLVIMPWALILLALLTSLMAHIILGAYRLMVAWGPMPVAVHSMVFFSA